MNKIRYLLPDIVIIILKCVLIVFMFGIILPYVLDLFIKYFIINHKYYKDSILVFDILSRNKDILLKFIYSVNEFFTI